MLGANKQKKLSLLFKALPDDFLQQLLAACEVQIDLIEEDDMPWDVLSDLARDALAQRGIFVPVSFVFEEDTPTEIAPIQELEQLSEIDLLSPEMELDQESDQPVVHEAAAVLPDGGIELEGLIIERPITQDPIIQDPITQNLIIQEPAVKAAEDVCPLLEIEPVALVPVLSPLPQKTIRPRNAMHAFFKPLEALIVDPPKMTQRVEGFLCSAHLPAIWRLLIEEEAGVKIRDSWVRFELIADDKAEEILPSITAGMHKAAHVTLRKLIDKSALKPAYQSYLIDRLRGKAGMEDLIELEKMLEFSSEIVGLNKALDEYAQLPVAQQQGLHTRLVAEILETSDSISLAQYNLCLMMRRLNVPTTAWRLQEGVQQDTASPHISEKLHDLIPNVLNQHIDDQVTWLEAGDPYTSFGGARLDVFHNVESHIRGLLGEVENSANDLFESQLRGYHERCVPLFKDFLRQCQASVHVALPLKRVNLQGAKDILRPDLKWSEHTTDVDQLIEAALEASEFVAKSDSIAVALNETPFLAQVTEPILDETRKYSNDLADLVRDARGELRLKALKHSEHVVKIGRILLGDVHADMLETALRQAAQAA